MALNLLGMTAIPLQTLPSREWIHALRRRCRTLIGPTILVPPNNLTGTTYSPALIVAFTTLAHEKNPALIIDKIWRDFVITGSPPHTLFSTLITLHPWCSTSSHFQIILSLMTPPRYNRTIFSALGFYQADSRHALDLSLSSYPARPRTFTSIL
jgi:hypothetical protein